MSELSRKIEAILFIATGSVSERELKSTLNISSHEIHDALHELQAIFENEEHGIFVQSLSGGWTLATKPEYSEILAGFREKLNVRKIYLSRAAIETAAIIAYNQPVTRSEIDEIRGVRFDSAVSRLLENGLVKIAGRSKTHKGSLIYRTTQKFFEVFGIDTLENLPAFDEIDIDTKEEST